MRIGASHLWITAGIILIFVGLMNLHRLDEWFPLPEGTVNPKTSVIEPPNVYEEVGVFLKRVVLISFWIYGIGFSVKQFSINKHLFTLNKHRENALNSYKLFSGTIGSDDPQARSQLMLQVARAIYEHGSSGYLVQRGDMKEPSIIELTRFLTTKP